MAVDPENVFSDFPELDARRHGELASRLAVDDDLTPAQHAELNRLRRRIDRLHEAVGSVELTVSTAPHDFGATHALRYDDGTEELLRIDGDAVLVKL